MAINTIRRIRGLLVPSLVWNAVWSHWSPVSDNSTRFFSARTNLDEGLLLRRGVLRSEVSATCPTNCYATTTCLTTWSTRLGAAAPWGLVVLELCSPT
eukprot:7303458-Prymnesium_polylepis.1